MTKEEAAKLIKSTRESRSFAVMDHQKALVRELAKEPRDEEQIKRVMQLMNDAAEEVLVASGGRGNKARKAWEDKIVSFYDDMYAEAATERKAQEQKLAQERLAQEKRAAESSAFYAELEKKRKAQASSGGGSSLTGSSGGGGLGGGGLLSGSVSGKFGSIGYDPSPCDEEDEEMEDENVEFQSQEHADEMTFGDDDMEVVAYDDNALDRILVGAKPKKRRRPPKGRSGMRPASAQDIQSAIARTPAQNRAALAQRIQQTQGMTGGYGQQQPAAGYPQQPGMPGYGYPQQQQPGMGYPYQQDAYGSYADEYMESDPGGYYTTDSFPQEGVEGIAAGATPKRRRPTTRRRPATAQRPTGLTQGYPQQQQGAAYPMNYGMPVAYDEDYFQSDPGGYYSQDSFPDEGTEGLVAVGSAKSGWRKFKNFFKKIFKGAAKSKMAKDALNAYSPGAGDAMQKGMQLIDSAASGNKDALAQVKGIADAAKAGDEAAQPAHDLLTTVNDARKEAKTETVTAAVGAAMQDMYSLVGRHLRVTEKGAGKEASVIMKITAVHPEAHIQVEIVGMPGSREWHPLEKIYRAMFDKEAVWTDEKGVPLTTGQPVVFTTSPVAATPKVGAESYVGGGGGGGGGFHHGGHGGGWGGMMRMDPRDLYLGPRIDVDDDGQPVFVGGHHGHHGGHGGGWGGWGWGGYPGLWAPPMWEEVTFIEEDDAQEPGVKVKKPVKAAPTAVGGGGGGGGGHHGGLPSGVMMGPGWGDYTPYPYPGADPWMFEEIEYQNEVGKKENK
jgi:hypothetical protein